MGTSVLFKTLVSNYLRGSGIIAESHGKSLWRVIPSAEKESDRGDGT